MLNSAMFGTEAFSDAEKSRIQNILSQKLSKKELATRAGPGGTRLSYVENHMQINIANKIFGLGGWSSEIKRVQTEFETKNGGKYKVGKTAIVRVTLKDGSFHEDIGFGDATGNSPGQAIEKAVKEAVTDARKRSLRLFGDALGNCIYDKSFVKGIQRGTINPPSVVRVLICINISLRHQFYTSARGGEEKTVPHFSHLLLLLVRPSACILHRHL